MKDQAEKLRELMRKKVFAVASGKGGVGKTTVSVNLSVELSRLGKKVLLIDGDISLANADIILGITPKKHIGHYIQGNSSIDEIIERVDTNLYFVPGASGVVRLTNLTENSLKKIKDIFSYFQSDITIIDLPAGIGKNAISLGMIADIIIVVVTPDPVSVTDCYSFIKVLTKSGFGGKIYVIVNMVRNQREKDVTFNTLNKVSQKYLGIQINLLGHISYDESVRESFCLQKPYVKTFPKSKASSDIKDIARKIIEIA